MDEDVIEVVIEIPKGSRNKIICLPHRDPLWGAYDEIEQLPEALSEIEHFFDVYKM